MQNKTVLNKHSATLNSGTVKRAIKSANSKSVKSNIETLKQCNITSEIRNYTELFNIKTMQP